MKHGHPRLLDVTVPYSPPASSQTGPRPSSSVANLHSLPGSAGSRAPAETQYVVWYTDTCHLLTSSAGRFHIIKTDGSLVGGTSAKVIKGGASRSLVCEEHTDGSHAPKDTRRLRTGLDCARFVTGWMFRDMLLVSSRLSMSNYVPEANASGCKLLVQRRRVLVCIFLKKNRIPVSCPRINYWPAVLRRQDD